MSLRNGHPRPFPALIWFLALGLIVLGPLLATGYLLLLDSPVGPDSPWPSITPLPSEGLVNSSAPFAILVRAVGSLSSQLSNKLLVFLVIIIGGFGLFRFLVSFLSMPKSVSIIAGTFFVINPFFYERLLSGQVFFAIGCALLPWMLAPLAETCTSKTALPALKTIAWTGVISLVDIHVGGMAVLLLMLAIGLSHRRWTARLALWGVGITTVLILNMFWILPSFLASEAQRLGAGDLLAYAPRPRSAAILAHELMLHGFWRTEFTTPLRSNPALFICTFVPLFSLAVVGVVRAMRFERWRRPASALGAAALVAIIVGMGTSFPLTRRLIKFLFDHVPGYGIYREPQKWIALLVLAYGVFLAVGLQPVADRIRRQPSAILAAVILPLLATPMALWGFGGQVEVSDFPGDWARAKQQIHEKDGNLLFLPWNLYQPIPFADNRTIANPGDHYFGSRTLVSGDAALGRRDTAPSDPRDQFVYALIRRGEGLTNFGHLISPLGVRFVALAHIADAPDYGWLNRQDDLRVVLEGDDLTLYENTAWRGSIYGLEDGETNSAFRDVVRNRETETSAATQLRVIEGNEKEPLGGPVVLKSAPGWTAIASSNLPMVGTDRSCGDGWRLGDSKPVCHLGAMAAFETPTNRSETLWRPGVFVQLVGLLLSFIGAGGLWWWIRKCKRQEA